MKAIPNSSVTYHPQGDTHVEVYDWEGNPLEVADVYLSFNTVVVKLMPPLGG
jgi:hypothetical protein